ncbi:MAG: enoyl-CoA hydratase, partial [Mycobacteriaceae bacterium]|nr:enoyl-CoA hydratase [Mycobacteriaceae bacterium]
HHRLLDRALELAGQIAEVPAPIMQGLKEIYTTGAAAVIDPALTAEQAIAPGLSGMESLEEKYRAVADRNRRQIDG